MENLKEQLISIKTAILQLISAQQAWHYKLIPFQSKLGVLDCVSSQKEASFPTLQEELEVLLGMQIQLHYLSQEELSPYISQYYRKETRSSQSTTLGNSKDSLVDLIQEAKQLGSSDIHLEVYAKTCRVRMRIDGLLVERYVLDKKDYPSLVNKIKIKANLDIAEKRLPQDGRIFFAKGQDKFDIRVSVLPTLHGEKVVMRLLNSDATRMDLNSLGFSQEGLATYLEEIKKPEGIILISGPTGSGKTTTLYATLHLLNQTVTNILTIEDPIEYTLDGINQVQLKEAIGFDFALALRTFLRQDPNIIMVGEIRDKSTAEAAIRASLTGHLVFSTIHTNSAWGIVARLVDMGVPSYLLADTLNMAIAQRLLRLLCPHCKEVQDFNPSDYPRA
ncbi:MAG: GspE/PulE family protein, partial [Saprospiraceae bacterium]|nr:GspE/PulE family protein [Saprospiraceae bacterium]